MFNSKIPSPARSLGGKATPKRHKRRTRSVCSPTRSENSVKLTALIPDDFVVSPLPKRRSILTDDTDIEMPKRHSWWKKLNENSRDVMELLEQKDVPDDNILMEKNFDIDILSQEKKNYTIDLPDSSDCESINSIVIPQRKLFTHKENHPPKRFGNVMNNREELAKFQQSHVDHVQEIDVRPKSLFNQVKNMKSRAIFPPALLNTSANKSIANKTELQVIESKGQAHSLFGNRLGTKRKNVFADFIASESEDEISEVQPKIFGFKTKQEVKQKMSHVANELQNSPTTSIIDIDMDDWKHLPSSTMVENQTEEQEATPSKRKRLSKLLESKSTEMSQKLLTSTMVVNRIEEHGVTPSKSKSLSKLLDTKNLENMIANNHCKDVKNNLSPTTNYQLVNTPKEHETDEMNINNSVEPNPSRNNTNSCDNMKSFTVKKHTSNLQQKNVNDIEKNNLVQIENNEERMINDIYGDNNVRDKQKTLSDSLNVCEASKIQDKQDRFTNSPSVSEAEDDFTLEYENEEDGVVHEESFKNNLDNAPFKILDESKNKESHKSLVNNKISQDKNMDDINATETVRTENKEGEENNIGDNTHKNKSNEISNNSDSRHNKIYFNNEGSEQTEHVSESGDSQEVQDDETGTENEVHEENENEESEDLEAEDVETSESEENENAHDISNNENSTKEERMKTVFADENQIDVIDENDKLENRKSDTSDKETNINYCTNIKYTNSSSTECKKNNVANENTPEAILFQETNNLLESFTLKEINSPRKTKSMLRRVLKPSLAPVRESTGFSDNTGNSSANSGWDSHRTTRKTLRKTFGKDFTPRKSLRTLVMEKAANLQFNPDLRDIDYQSKPDSTELVTYEAKSDKRQTFNPDLCDISKHPNANSTELITHEVKSAKQQTFNPELHDISKHPNANSTELLAQEERPVKRQTLNPDLRDISKHPQANSTELPASDVNEQLEQSDVDSVEKIQIATQNAEESNQNVNETRRLENRSVEKSYTQLAESEHYDVMTEKSQAGSVEEEYPEIVDEDYNGTTEQSEAESDEEMDDVDDDNSETMEQSRTESGEEKSDELDEFIDNETAEVSEAELVEENPVQIDDDNIETTDHAEVESEEEDDEGIENDDSKDTTEQTQAEEEGDEEEIRENEENVNETTQHSTNESSHHAEMGMSNDYTNENGEQSDEENVQTHDTEKNETADESDHELSKRMRQTTLETYLQKIRQDRLDREKKIREEITKTLKVSTNRNCFKLPYTMPPQRASKPAQKAKRSGPQTAPLHVLPAEVEADMRYRPPKRFQPSNASWATKRLYKYLESKLEPKYSYMCRVRAEKLVATLHEFTRQLRRQRAAPPALVDALKREMARLRIVDTHYEFYHFFHEYMPREIRVKVNPDPVNKVQVPRDVFANILR